MNFKIIFAVVIASLFSFSFKPEDEKEKISWKLERPLTWDDFKGKPEKRFAAASTSYDILKEVTKNSVEIKAVFFTQSSWKKTSWINDQVLAHEQKHFDIVELYARKLRKQIKETKFTSYEDLKSKVETLYDANDKAMDKYQDLYDEETDGSMNGDKQREWEAKIMKEIKALDAYKETVLQINFAK
ncbi:MAG: DUF922 domain-containing protein [Bacteroidia bacterium]|nr:DUF922 domain-containing protein [Bacteroidia bacterium]